MKNQFWQITFCALVAALVVVTGCHRGYYRRQADAEAQALIRDKANDPRWALPDTTIQIKRESRMYNPFSPDHPPMPPDDPSSHLFMETVDGKRGYRHWHADGDTAYVESPDWYSYLPVNADGFVELDMDRAVTVALTNSTSYQRQREELYLSALDVSLERFGFDSQLFAGWNSFFTTAGRFRGAGGSSSTVSAGTNGSGIQLQRLGTSGANMVVGLANSILWQFAGPDTQTANTLINFSVVQPLMANGGRDRIMESLTQAERTLLANVRQMEQYRQGFYLQTTTGRSPGSGPSRGGNFLSAPSGGSGSAGGFLGLLQTQQSIRIQEFNVASLRNVLDQFVEFAKADRLDALQLSQAETSLYNAQRSLLSARTNYQTDLDRYKRTLGLPPTLPIVIRDTFLRSFELIDDESNARQAQLSALQLAIGESLIDAARVVERDRVMIQPEPANPPDPNNPQEQAPPLQLTEEYTLAWSDELKQKLEALVPLVAQIEPLIESITVEDAGRISSDIERFRTIRPNRAAALEALRARVQDEKFPSDLDVSILQEASLADPETLVLSLKDLTDKIDVLRSNEQQLKALLADTIQNGSTLDPKLLYARVNDELLVPIPTVLTKLTSYSLELSLVQALARTDSIELPRVSIDPDSAIEIARTHRRDWMNARANLVDSWRRIDVVANQLESQLNLVFQGDIGNVGSNPFRIRYETGQLRAGVQFDAPITRLSQRNQYRTQLIQYQRDRRAFYEFGDEVARILRQNLREIELNKILFELTRRSIKVAVQQVELARLKLEQPPRGTQGNVLGATTARDLTGAINNLQANQSSFLDVWVTFEVLRRNLDFDMGTMQISADGFWFDPGVIDATIGEGRPLDPLMQAPDVPNQFPDLGPITDPDVPVEIRIEPPRQARNN